jgi:hypothetical protein
VGGDLLFDFRLDAGQFPIRRQRRQMVFSERCFNSFSDTVHAVHGWHKRDAKRGKNYKSPEDTIYRDASSFTEASRHCGCFANFNPSLPILFERLPVFLESFPLR